MPGAEGGGPVARPRAHRRSRLYLRRRPEVTERLRELFAPLEEDLPPGSHFSLRTDQPVEAIVDQVVSLLDWRLAGRPPAGGASA